MIIGSVEGVHAVKYIVTVLPDYEEFEDWPYFVVTVTYRGKGRYAVYQGAWESNSLPYAANGDGEWDMEGSEQREDTAWLDRHRFSLDQALRMARRLAPAVGIYSHRDKKFITAADLLEQAK
jgi:hypothetical protein